MFAELLFEKSSAAYENKILLLDKRHLENETGYGAYFEKNGFEVVFYVDDLDYRIRYEERAKKTDTKMLIIADGREYIPYDVHRRFREFEVSVAELFPRLNAAAVSAEPNVDYELLTLAYRQLFCDLSEYEDTKEFLENTVCGRENIRVYVRKLCDELKNLTGKARKYADWFGVASLKAKIHVLSEKYRIPVQIEDCNVPFQDFILKDFGKLSQEMAVDAPVLVSRAMEFIHEHSKKHVVIVMDGMSEFDWMVLADSFAGMKYSVGHSMAMIPTVTSVSRQCLLSDKFPRELENPWSQSKEKKEFVQCARRLGYSEVQIGYERGYEAEFGPAVKCAAIIINDIDDMVHGQLQGRLGMLNDVGVLTEQGKLVNTVRRMLRQGFDVYISADHGNTPCVGMGKLMRTGVETATKSRRMIALKDFADKDGLREKYKNLIEFPGYYLDKQYDYLICGAGESFDAAEEMVMSHGGITIDEVVVPFITIKAVDYNG